MIRFSVLSPEAASHRQIQDELCNVLAGSGRTEATTTQASPLTHWQIKRAKVILFWEEKNLCIYAKIKCKIASGRLLSKLIIEAAS